jgi:hypothetical protein
MHDLFYRQMSRREFLVTCGIILLGLLGVTALLRNLSGLFGEQTRPVRLAFPSSARLGFGIGSYGK